MKYILVIAGSDSSGGAGVQADIKTIASLGAHALTVITAVTAQNSLGITAVHTVPAEFISLQLETVVSDQFPDAVKIGMLYSGALVREVAGFVKRHELPNVVVDPVLKATTGKGLLEPDGLSPLKHELLPLAKVVTPNWYEAGVLAGKKIKNLDGVAEAAGRIKKMGPDVVITGGHQEHDCTDFLYDGKSSHAFSGLRIDTVHTHGSGRVFSSALATLLAEEENVVTATQVAHDFTRRAISDAFLCGRGSGTVRSALGLENRLRSTGPGTQENNSGGKRVDAN